MTLKRKPRGYSRSGRYAKTRYPMDQLKDYDARRNRVVSVGASSDCTLAVPTDGKPVIILGREFFPLPMEGGIDIVTAGTTAGPGGVTVWLIIDDGA